MTTAVARFLPQQLEAVIPAHRTRRVCLTLVITLVVAGEVCRLAQYLSVQSFWPDEIAVMENTQHIPAKALPFVALTRSPAGVVSAPPLFLLATQWMGERFGYHEWSVRFLPEVCAVLSMPLFAGLAWRLVSPPAAVWAVALFAFSDPAIFEGATVKPYSGDVLLAVLLPLMALAPRRSAPPGRTLAWTSLVAAAACLISLPIVFVFASVVLAMWADFSGGRMRRVIAVGVRCLPVAAAFMAIYFFCIRAEVTPKLYTFWSFEFPDYAKPLSVPRWLNRRTIEIFRYLFYPIGTILIPAAIAGVWVLRRERNHRLLMALAAPLALNLVSSLLHQYPYGGERLALYMLPSLSLLIGVGADALVNLLPEQVEWLQFVLRAVPAAMGCVAVFCLFRPRNHGSFRDALDYLDAHRAPGEKVYIAGPYAVLSASWYLPRPDSLVHLRPTDPTPIPAQSFWVVVSYMRNNTHDKDLFMRQPGHHIDASRSFHTDGADVAWFVPNQAGPSS